MLRRGLGTGPAAPSDRIPLVGDVGTGPVVPRRYLSDPRIPVPAAELEPVAVRVLDVERHRGSAFVSLRAPERDAVAAEVLLHRVDIVRPDAIRIVSAQRRLPAGVEAEQRY